MRLMIKDAPGTSTYAPIINIVIPKPTPANFINLLFLVLIIMVACILIDKLRMFITNPIERLILKINWDGYTNKLVTKIDNWIG